MALSQGADTLNGMEQEADRTDTDNVGAVDAVHLGAEHSWDDEQQAVLQTVRKGQSLVITGPPGSGKSVLSIEIAAQALLSGAYQPDDILVLTSSRRSAARSRDAFMQRIGRTLHGTAVRSTASLAFAIIAAQCRLQGVPDPVLATGPEQDADLAQLLVGHMQSDGVPIDWPPEITSETLQLRGFRAQLRDLLMRCAERGLSPADLADLGREHDRPHWVAAAQLYDEYLAVTELSRNTPDRGPRYDAATIVDQAAWIAQKWVRDEQKERLRWRLVIVDEYQDATAAAARLFGALQRDGAQLVLFSDPDQAVQGFRGSRPDLAGRADLPPGRDDTEIGQFGAVVKVLHRSHRLNDQVRDVVARISHHIGASAGVQHRLTVEKKKTTELDADELPRGREAVSATETEPDPSQPVIERRHARSRAEETAWIAWRIRQAHYFDELPWSQCAVLARSGSHVHELVRGLQRAGVPAMAQGSDLPLRAEPAVRMLLETIERTRSDAWDDAALHELLVSAYGDLDAVSVRELRRSLSVAAPRGRTTSELVAALTNDDGLNELHMSRVAGTPIAAAAHRAAAMIAAARALHDTDNDPAEVCWRVWQAADCADRWREQALHVGPRSVVANANLDAVMTLFKHIENFAQRYQGATVERLIAEINRLDIPADSLAATAKNEQIVEVLTAAQAAGRQWSYVIVAGLQAGSWPDLRLRDTLLGAQQLADLVDGRGDGPDLTAARKAVLDDELRLFLVACSRTTGALTITCVDGEDDQPSAICDLVCPAPTTTDELPPPLDLRGIVLRSRIAGEQEPADDWAQLLAYLARHGVTAANPDTWYGMAPPSSTAPLVASGQPISVSPSRLALVHQCAMRWAAETSDAKGGDQFSNELGTLIHDIARDHPTSDAAELLEVLQDRWSELGLSDGWPTIQRAHEAESMVRALGQFQQKNPPPKAVEAPFAVDMVTVRIRGSIDRIDRTEQGLVIRDYKTGRTVMSVRDATVDPQLASYQLAIERGALQDIDLIDDVEPVAGAELIYLGSEEAKVTKRKQPALSSQPNPQWIAHMATQAAQIMSSGRLWAKINAGCRTCPVHESCPVQPEGQPLVPQRAPANEMTRAPLSDFDTAERRAEAAASLNADVDSETTLGNSEAADPEHVPQATAIDPITQGKGQLR